MNADDVVRGPADRGPADRGPADRGAAECSPSGSPGDFASLDPIRILDAVEAAGWPTDGRVSALNSYENRVYSIGLDSGDAVVGKFYRPARWSNAAIDEEHRFCFELREHDLSVVAPLRNTAGESLLTHDGFRFCLFPRVGGRPPEPGDPEQLRVIGRTVARMHRVGELEAFDHRPAIDVERLGEASVDTVLDSDHLPRELCPVYESLAEELLDQVDERIDVLDTVDSIRLHGDFHMGNLLWGDDGLPHIVDFDDTAMGPAIQDLWMSVSGNRADAEAQLGELLDGYTEFREFDLDELALIEPLRALRILHYAAWISRRWDDPAFRIAFPFFAEPRFWDEQIVSMREQLALLDEPPLRY